MKLRTWIAIGTFAFSVWRGMRRMKSEVRLNAKDLRRSTKRTLRRAERAI